MNLLKKVSIGTSMILLLTTNVVAATYQVKAGDTLYGIVYKLGFQSIEESGLKAPSGNIHKIFPGDVLEYKGKKKKRFVLQKSKVDLDKFCFKSNRSIHYRAKERCK